MWFVIGALSFLTIVLLISNIYRKHVIKDLEQSKSSQDRRRVAQIIDMFNEMKDIMNLADTEEVRDKMLRDYMNEKISKYSGLYRKMLSFDAIVTKACEEYIKKN